MIKNPIDTALENQLDALKLPFLKEHCRPLAAEATAKHWSHLDYLVRLIEGSSGRASRPRHPSADQGGPFSGY